MARLKSFTLKLLTFLCLCSCKQEAITTYSVPKKTNEAVNSEKRAIPQLAGQAQGFKTPHWEAPPAWKAQNPGPMRKARWIVQSNGQQAEITVSAFPGNVGGDIANVNRWRAQIGLPAIDINTLEIETEWITIGERPSRFLILKGEEPSKSIIAAIVPRKDETWFFKIMGDTALVIEEQATFRAFLNTLNFEAR